MISEIAEDRPLSLYLHIPFCYKKCDYCAFYSIEDNSVIDAYFSLLLKEIDSVVDDWKKPFLSIYIGGGNPGLIGYERILKLIKAAEKFGKAEEVTVELNPENVDTSIAMLNGYATRISVGIQSLKDKTLKTLGRNASREASLKALRILSSSDFDFNADIITSVPGESVEDSLEDIRMIAQYNPSHISYYCLAFEEDTPLIRRLSPLGDEVESEFLKKGWELLGELGYEHYEVSAFAKPGKRSIHNQVYWNLGQYIGLGATAESSFGFKKIISARNQETVEDFLKKPELDCTPITAFEQEEEYIMLRLRVKEGIVKKSYKSRFGYDFDSRFRTQIEGLNPSWIINDSSHFSLTEDGLLVLDHIIITLVMAI